MNGMEHAETVQLIKFHGRQIEHMTGHWLTIIEGAERIIELARRLQANQIEFEKMIEEKMKAP